MCISLQSSKSDTTDPKALHDISSIVKKRKRLSLKASRLPTDIDSVDEICENVEGNEKQRCARNDHMLKIKLFFHYVIVSWLNLQNFLLLI